MLEITLQYFDGCPNWEVIDRRLAEALDGRSDVRVAHQRVETADDAARLEFHGSPTVLVDGVDPFADEHTPVGLACRVFRTPAGLAGSPAAAALLLLREPRDGAREPASFVATRAGRGTPGSES